MIKNVSIWELFPIVPAVYIPHIIVVYSKHTYLHAFKCIVSNMIDKSTVAEAS